MRSVVADEDVKVVVDLMLDGDFVVPDIGSVTWTLRGNDGTPVTGYVDQSVTTDSSTTQIVVTIPASENAKSATVEKRTVVIKYTVNNVPYQEIRHYRLTDWLNHTVTPEMVRAKLGLSIYELPDEDIDILQAYYDLEDALTSTLNDILIEGSRKTFFANEAIACKAALAAFPSIETRIASAEGDDTLSWKRLQKIDVANMKHQLSGQYSNAIAVIDDDAAPSPVLFTSPTPTDPITGQ